MSAPKSRHSTALLPHAAFAAVLQAAANLEGSAAIASAAVEGIGSTPREREAARYTADRLLCADVRLLREAVDAMEGAMIGGTP